MNYYRYIRGSVHRGTSNKYDDDYIYIRNDDINFVFLGPHIFCCCCTEYVRKRDAKIT